MKILLADPTGFCFGVKRAIEELERALSVYGTVYSTGSPIHNPQEVERLRSSGLVIVEDVSEIPQGAAIFIRAHGETPAVLSEIQGKAGVLIDGTCPFVKTAQKKALALSEQGYFVIIIGNPDHPEVKGIRGFVSGDSLVVESILDLPRNLVKDKVGVVCQTTQRYEALSSVVSGVVYRCMELKVYNTICNATCERQKAIRKLSESVDGIILIGGRNSANTASLYQIASSKPVKTVWVEKASELEESWFAGMESIGIAAGASTPEWLIEELKYKLKNTGS